MSHLSGSKPCATWQIQINQNMEENQYVPVLCPQINFASIAFPKLIALGNKTGMNSIVINFNFLNSLLLASVNEDGINKLKTCVMSLLF